MEDGQYIYSKISPIMPDTYSTNIIIEWIFVEYITFKVAFIPGTLVSFDNNPTLNQREERTL